MSRGVNRVILIGHAGKDPEVRFSPSGTCFAKLTIATSDRWKDKDDQPQTKTQWHNLEFNGRLAEIAGELVKKGSKIYVEGSIDYSKWKGQGGQERYATTIRCREMQLLDAPGHEHLPPEARTPPAGKNTDNRPEDVSTNFDDSIPF